MGEATWRSHAGPIIAKVIRETGTEDMKALRKALREAYPYGMKKHWPYKIWLDEIKRQLATGRYTPAPPPGETEPGPLEIMMKEQA